MKPYPSYKDSGIEWIDKIPSHWNSSPIFYVSSVDNCGIWGEDEPSDGRVGIPIPTTAQITMEGEWLIDKMAVRYVTPTEKDYYICRTGDIVVVKSSGSATNIISGKCGFVSEVENECFAFGNFLLRITPTDYNPKLLYYILSSHLTKQRIERMVSSTTYPNLKVNEYVKSQILIPPQNEQDDIADFLDKKTALIDGLIEKKKRQIDLLKEQRQAVINQAVTKGLDPSVEMKDSGTYWLGKVPKSWTLKKFSYCTSIMSGQVDPSIKPYCDMPLIAPNHIESKTGRILGIETAKDQGADSGKYLFESGEVLYSKIRPHLQKVCIAPVDGICSADMYAIKPKDELLNTFLVYYMLTEVFTAYTVDTSMRVAMPKINRDDLTRSCIAFPDKAEQETIVEYIETETNKIDQSVSKAEKQIGLLQEYRKALISEVVTGKIDVREAV